MTKAERRKLAQDSAKRFAQESGGTRELSWKECVVIIEAALLQAEQDGYRSGQERIAKQHGAFLLVHGIQICIEDLPEQSQESG